LVSADCLETLKNTGLALLVSDSKVFYQLFVDVLCELLDELSRPTSVKFFVVWVCIGFQQNSIAIDDSFLILWVDFKWCFHDRVENFDPLSQNFELPEIDIDGAMQAFFKDFKDQV
jgi:hypothetical protein